MLCFNPIPLGGRQVGCGTCPACRVNRRRDWTARLLLHTAGHDGPSAFITLTYRDEDLAYNSDGEPVLSSQHLRWFSQRLRRDIGAIRYCYVGEFGDRYRRPHYHGLLWCEKGKDIAGAVRRAWDKGFVDVGEVSEASIMYTISYLLKGVDKGGQDVCFARFSEGLGTAALSELRRVARADTDGVLQLPREFRLNGQVWPVPRYIRLKLCAEGYSFERRRDEVLEESFVQALRGSSRAMAVSGITAYREVQKEDVEKRRIRSKAKLSHSFQLRRKYETL